LHDRGAPVAGREFTHGQFLAAGHPRWVLYKVDVKGSAAK